MHRQQLGASNAKSKSSAPLEYYRVLNIAFMYNKVNMLASPHSHRQPRAEDSGNGGNAEIRSSHSAPGGACAANESLSAQGGQDGVD